MGQHFSRISLAPTAIVRKEPRIGAGWDCAAKAGQRCPETEADEEAAIQLHIISHHPSINHNSFGSVVHGTNSQKRWTGRLQRTSHVCPSLFADCFPFCTCSRCPEPCHYVAATSVTASQGADCAGGPPPSWASVTFGVVLCSHAAGPMWVVFRHGLLHQIS